MGRLSEELRGHVAPVTEAVGGEDMISMVEEIVVSIEEAIDAGKKYRGVTKHLNMALRHAKQAESAAEGL